MPHPHRILQEDRADRSVAAAAHGQRLRDRDDRRRARSPHTMLLHQIELADLFGKTVLVIAQFTVGKTEAYRRVKAQSLVASCSSDRRSCSSRRRCSAEAPAFDAPPSLADTTLTRAPSPASVAADAPKPTSRRPDVLPRPRFRCTRPVQLGHTRQASIQAFAGVPSTVNGRSANRAQLAHRCHRVRPAAQPLEVSFGVALTDVDRQVGNSLGMLGVLA